MVAVCLFQLAPDDAWRCPHCKQLQQGRIKLSLWTLPDVLILHLKRFRQVIELNRTPLTQTGGTAAAVGIENKQFLFCSKTSPFSLCLTFCNGRRLEILPFYFC